MGPNNRPNYLPEKSHQPTINDHPREDGTVNIVNGMMRLIFSGANISSANALTRESGVSGSWMYGVDFFFDFLSMIIKYDGENDDADVDVKNI